MSLLAPGLRLPRHRATTAHLCAAYPFHAEAGLGPRGLYLGTNRLAGDAAFCFDPFELYTAEILTNPNMVVLGEPGCGKSAAVKTLLYRMIGVLGSPGGGPRWVAICDPKGEYQPLARALGLDVLRLHPGGATRLNPLDAGPAGADVDPLELAGRRTSLLTALVGGVLRRPLTAVEDAAVGWAVTALDTVERPTLADVARLLATPTAAMAEQAATTPAELARQVDPARFALGKLLDRDLRGMFDGLSTVRVDWHGRGLVLDLSAVHTDPDALALVMIAATAWLQALLAPATTNPGGDGPRRVQVIDEAWALLASERTARYLQSCWKLCRAYGVANIAIAHRISDLRSQADDGTATAKVAEGLLADTQTRVLFRQSSDQITQARALLGLTETEADLLPRLAKGRALWKIAGGHAAVVAHVIGPDERHLVDTDANLLV